MQRSCRSRSHEHDKVVPAIRAPPDCIKKILNEPIAARDAAQPVCGKLLWRLHSRRYLYGPEVVGVPEVVPARRRSGCDRREEGLSATADTRPDVWRRENE